MLTTHFTFQAPAVDVVAVGLANGQIVLHNLKFDETVMKFTQDWGPVTTITFRTGKYKKGKCLH
jgi:U3 small nucleolar RNA-associated protein 21